MFLRFAVENHRSLRRYTELSFVSTAQKDAPNWRMPAHDAPHGVLPVLALYGANASGKTNLLHALLEFGNHVARSFTDLTPDAKVPWSPWCTSSEPTRFDADVLVDGVRYHYGFRWDHAGYREEWLYTWPRARRQVLFHRDHTQADAWYFGPELGGQRVEIRKATRANALFLSTAAQYGHAELTPMWQALAGVHDDAPVELRGHPMFPPDAALLAPESREVVLHLLRAADLGVVDFRTVANEARHASVSKALVELLGAERAAPLAKSLEGQVEIWFTHAAADGSTWELKPELESRGTHILLARLNDILAHLASAKLMVVDELDTSLHPDLCAALVGLFTDARTNPRGAQLVFSTHDRGLLNHLRRDEVILLDKADDGSTVLRAASDFRGLRGREPLDKVHAEGKIGGVPTLGNWTRAVEGWHGKAN